MIADVGFSYSDNLNDINEAQLKISGTGETKRSLFEIGSEVKIYRNGTLAFHGIINGISFLDGGGISADILGYESWLAKENGSYAGSPYSATASATIATAIVGESNYFTDGTVEAGANIDFRIEATDSLFNAISRLIKRVGQDIGIDYANSEVDILDHKGSSTSVATLNDGLQIGDMVVRQSYPIGNDVRVFGKSEGSTRIKSDNGSYGQDATSKATYGIIRKDYIDNSVTSAGEANALANQLVAKYKDPVKVYEFDVLNPHINLESGDVITLNSSTKGLSAEEVRIVSLKRGVDASREFMTIEVTNKEYSTKTKNINQKIAELENQAKRLQTYDSYQEEYSNQVNTTTSIGGVIDVYPPNALDLNNYGIFDCLFLVNDVGNLLISADGYLEISGALGVVVDNEMDMSDQKITSLADPGDNQDAATKKYIDDAINVLKSGYWSCTGVQFKAIQPDVMDLFYHGLTKYVQASADGITLVAPVSLPHGSTVLRVIVYGNAAAEAISWDLRRMPLGVDSSQFMAGAVVNTQDTSISYATIDNSAYNYALRVATTLDKFDTGDVIYGARIIYS